MDKETCPHCGFVAHKLCRDDNGYWKYVCERCGSIFVVKAAR